MQSINQSINPFPQPKACEGWAPPNSHIKVNGVVPAGKFATCGLLYIDGVLSKKMDEHDGKLYNERGAAVTKGIIIHNNRLFENGKAATGMHEGVSYVDGNRVGSTADGQSFEPADTARQQRMESYKAHNSFESSRQYDTNQLQECLVDCAKALKPGEIISVLLGAQEDFELNPEFLKFNENIKSHINVNCFDYINRYGDVNTLEKEVNKAKTQDKAFFFMRSDALHGLNPDKLKEMMKYIVENQGKLLITDAVGSGTITSAFLNACKAAGFPEGSICYSIPIAQMRSKKIDLATGECVEILFERRSKEHSLTKAEDIDAFNAMSGLGPVDSQKYTIINDAKKKQITVLPVETAATHP